MPAMPSVPGVVRCTMVYDIGADTNIINGFYVHYTGSAPTGAELVTFGDAIVSAFNAHLAPFYASGRAGPFLECVDLSSPTSAIGTSTTEGTGAESGNDLPAEVAAVAKFHVARRYRGGHPRTYMPFGTATDVASGQLWESAFTAGLKSALEAFFVDLLTDGWSGAGTLSHVAVSFFEGFTNVLYPSGRYHVRPTVRGTPLVDAITSYDVNPKFGSQRRRSQQSS